MPRRISVVICTRDRPGPLRRVLESLAEQTAFGGAPEIIVVDNGSGDDTRAVALAGAGSRRPRFRYLREHRNGLSHARNRGVQAAAGDIVAFIDDDAVADRQWIRALERAFDRPERPAVVVGPIHPLPPFTLPSWFPARLRTHLSLVDLGPRTRLLHYPHYGFGTNMAVNRHRLPPVARPASSMAGGRSPGDIFDPSLGRCAAQPFRTGEETDLMLRVERRGECILYAPGARVWHEVQPERIRPAWLYRQTLWVGCASASIEAGAFPPSRVLGRSLLSAAALGAALALCGSSLVTGPPSLAVLARCVACNRFGYLYRTCRRAAALQRQRPPGPGQGRH